MQRKFIIIGSLMGLLAVMFGAFGAHSLEKLIEVDQIATFETGVTYQFYHTFAILIVALLFKIMPSKPLRIAGWFFVSGIICFSGSLYLLACKDILSINTSFLGPITPIGGMFFIIGWAILAVQGFKMKDE